MAHGLFLYAENLEGKIVHVDDVPNGLNCGCVCPHCHERLLARHGDINEHGFAHHSDVRKATLEICYNVIMYKLAEQIIQIKKRIHVPSYYGIFPERDITFSKVKINSDYEREDKQPDVIATTTDGKEYLIEFVFNEKVQHKKPIDYKNLTCLEVDLSKQSMETLEEFLLTSSNDKRWINNDDYFNQIERTYQKTNNQQKVVLANECHKCVLYYECPAGTIENNGNIYRLCRQKEYENKLAGMIQKDYSQKELKRIESQIATPPKVISERRSCYNCEYNIHWKNHGGMAYCDPYMSFNHANPIPHTYAEQCPHYSLREDV